MNCNLHGYDVIIKGRQEFERSDDRGLESVTWQLYINILEPWSELWPEVPPLII